MKKARILLAVFLYYTGVLCLLNRMWGRKYARILSFHRIVENPTQADSTPSLPYLTARNFESLLQYLKEKYHILSLDEWVSSQKKPAGVILTFDDGWKDNFTYAFSLLKKYEVPAVIYLTVSLVGTRKTLWQVRLFGLLCNLDPQKVQNLADPEIRRKLNGIWESGFKIESFRALTSFLKTKPNQQILNLVADLEGNEEELAEQHFLGWEEIKEMRKSGICFGSHTLNHVILTRENKETIKEELDLSKEILEKHLKTEIHHFAFPNGEFNHNIKSMVQQAGYVSAVTIREDLNSDGTDKYELNRIEMEENKVTDLKGKFCRPLYELETCRLYLKIKNLSKSKPS